MGAVPAPDQHEQGVKFRSTTGEYDVRNLPGLVALALVSLSSETMAADCLIDHIGKKYNAQVEVTLGDVNNPTRVWVFSGSGAPMVRYTAPSLIEVLPNANGTSAAGSGLNACSNALAVFDAIGEAQRNYNQCAHLAKGETETSTQRWNLCNADAG